MPLAVATGIASWLQERQLDGGRVQDSVHRVTGTYSDGFAALTFGLLDWPQARDRALAVALKRPPDSEFDDLALALLRELVGLPVPARQLYQGTAIVSNNWALFRALTRALTGSAQADFSLVERQLPAGLFPDSPVGQATPVCYHAKICATLALTAILRPDHARLERLRQGLSALLALVGPSGTLVPYGRSRNTLFAYGSAYLALRLGSSLFADGRLNWAAARVLERLQRFQQADGHIPACLNGDEWLRRDWDIYINNPDYNAYAAACLLLAARLVPSPPAPLAPEEGVFDLGPILSVRDRASYFACSTSGEFAPYASPFFCDTRYAGLHPLLFENNDGQRTFDENYCWDGRDSTRACLVDPRLSPWTAFWERGGRRYWVRRFEQIRWDLASGILTVSGSGRPGYSQPVPRWRRFVDSRLLGKKGVPQMRHQQLSQVLQATLEFDFTTLKLRRSSQWGGGKLRNETMEETLCPR